VFEIPVGPGVDQREAGAMPRVLRRADPSRPDADPRSRRGPIAATADPSSACQAMSAVGPVIDQMSATVTHIDVSFRTYRDATQSLAL
jgi:hypothetical protein